MACAMAVGMGRKSLARLMSDTITSVIVEYEAALDSLTEAQSVNVRAVWFFVTFGAALATGQESFSE